MPTERTIKRREYHRQWYLDNWAKQRKYQKILSKKNREANNEWARSYRKMRRETDINYRIKERLRSRLHSIKRNGSGVRDLGCTIEEFRKYIESKFLPGMTWENWSMKGWHMDHIIPISSFNLQDRKQLLKACNYRNLQPLWAVDNYRKSNKLK